LGRGNSFFSFFQFTGKVNVKSPWSVLAVKALRKALL